MFLSKKKSSKIILLGAGLFGVLLIVLLGWGCRKDSSEGRPPAPRPAAVRPTPPSAGNKAQGETIRIGVVVSLTGEQAPWGIECCRAVRFAVEEFNKAHSLQGKKIELLVGDAGSKPELGRSAAEKLISQGVLGLIGDMSSGITAQIGKAAFAHGVPLIINGGSQVDLTRIGKNVFRVNYDDAFQGHMMAVFAHKELMLRKIALITDRKQPYSVSLSNSFRKRFTELGGEIVGEEFYESGQVDFRSLLTRLKSCYPEAIFASGYYHEVGPIVRQCRQVGLEVPLLGGDGWDCVELINLAGSSVYRCYYCNHYANNEPRPEVEAFVKRWVSRFGKPPSYMTPAVSYDAACLMMDALSRCKTLDSKSLMEALENTVDYHGVTGTITLKGMNGTPPKRALVVQLEPSGQKFRKAYEYWDEMQKR
jgi:branched-chain amino acid transport system substrate-binding protein